MAVLKWPTTPPALSQSPVGAGFFFLSKRDGTLFPGIDFRGLNSITIRNKDPLRLLNSAFKLLHGATSFSKLDLCNAYHLLQIREGDEWKTAFNTPLGHFEYLVVPFGVINAPAIFQALINDVLRDLLKNAPACTVHRILDIHYKGHRFQHLVDWEGNGPEDRS